MMEAAAQADAEVIVLDRPNPNGSYVDGPLLEERYRSGVVDTDLQGQGLGSRLLETAIRFCRENGYVRLMYLYQPKFIRYGR